MTDLERKLFIALEKVLDSLGAASGKTHELHGWMSPAESEEVIVTYLQAKAEYGNDLEQTSNF